MNSRAVKLARRASRRLVVSKVALGLVAASLAACSSKSDTPAGIAASLPADATTSDPSNSISQPSPSTSVAVDARHPEYATKPLRIRDANGWVYLLSPDLGIIEMTISKDITNSPPGSAIYIAHGPTSSSDGFPGTVAGATEGRDTPDLYFSNTQVLWPIRPDVARQLWPEYEPSPYLVDPITGQPVDPAAPYHCGPTDYDGTIAFTCEIDPFLVADPNESADMPEEVVNRLLAAHLFDVAPTVRIGLYGTDGINHVIIVDFHPDGRVQPIRGEIL